MVIVVDIALGISGHPYELVHLQSCTFIVRHCLSCGAQLIPKKDASGKYSFEGVDACAVCGVGFIKHDELLVELLGKKAAKKSTKKAKKTKKGAKQTVDFPDIPDQERKASRMGPNADGSMASPQTGLSLA